MREAVVFGLFETGLGVIRSLGQKNIKIIGIDYKKDIGWYSKYVSPELCPHPVNEEKDFLKWIGKTYSVNKKKLPAFFTGDDFLICFSENREFFDKYFTFILPEKDLIRKISDKYEQYKLASNAGITVPVTIVIKSTGDINDLDRLNFPVFIKGLQVNLWREKISGTIKGFEIGSKEELKNKLTEILNKNVPVIVQEIIQGPDTNHYKYCAYMNKKGETIAEFTLQKIRQKPIHYGVGSLVESIVDPDLSETGRKLFKEIGFTGIGSAEFKKDNRDGKLKLIEINSRYWQQNYLSTACGINFPYINYLDLTDEKQEDKYEFKVGIKWVNRYSDLDAYLGYRKEGLSFVNWRKSLKGKKVYSDFTWDDPLPFFYEIGFGWKLIKAPWFIIKRIFKKSEK
jgi:D-aspartate ligase